MNVCTFVSGRRDLADKLETLFQKGVGIQETSYSLITWKSLFNVDLQKDIIVCLK